LDLSDEQSLHYYVEMSKKFAPAIKVFGSFSAEELTQVQLEGRNAADEERTTFCQIQEISKQIRSRCWHGWRL
jgi:hypothetical protein